MSTIVDNLALMDAHEIRHPLIPLQVPLQFLLEAGALAGMGGVAGILIGLGGNLITCQTAGWRAVWPWSATAYAFGASVRWAFSSGSIPRQRPLACSLPIALDSAA